MNQQPRYIYSYLLTGYRPMRYDAYIWYWIDTAGIKRLMDVHCSAFLSARFIQPTPYLSFWIP